jgi:hypothetical protein
MADSNNGSEGDKAGQYADGLLKLVEETDKAGGISYCVECAKTGDLLYSSNSKPQAYSFCEGYRARDEAGDTKASKSKVDDSSPPEDKAKPTGSPDRSPGIDPVKVQRKRAVI